MEIIRNRPTPDGKLSANSFLPLCSTTAPCRTRNYPPIVSCRHAPPMVPSRTGNYPRTVSCHYAPPLPHVKQETIRKQFPVAMLLHFFMPDRKPSANSFLTPCSATAPCRTGNFSQVVSYHHAPPLPHAALSFRAQRSGAEKSPAEQFPAAMLHHCPAPDGKP